MGWSIPAAIIFLFSLCAAGLPLPQGGVGGGGGGGSGGGVVGGGVSHGQPQAGSPSTPGPGGGGDVGAGSSGVAAVGTTGSGGGGGGPSSVAAGFAVGVAGGGTGGGAGGGAAGGGGGGGGTAGGGWSTRPPRRGQGWRDWRHGDPTLIKGLWKSKGPLDSLGKAEVYIILALLIGFFTVVIGCWMSDNCWSPEPEGVVTLA